MVIVHAWKSSPRSKSLKIWKPPIFTLRPAWTMPKAIEDADDLDDDGFPAEHPEQPVEVGEHGRDLDDGEDQISDIHSRTPFAAARLCLFAGRLAEEPRRPHQQHQDEDRERDGVAMGVEM